MESAEDLHLKNYEELELEVAARSGEIAVGLVEFDDINEASAALEQADEADEADELHEEQATSPEEAVESADGATQPSNKNVALDDEGDNGSLDTLQLFKKRAVKIRSLLTPEREKQLALRIERGDLAAKDELIESNLRLVINISNGYVDQGLPRLDLIQGGMKGLIRAAEKFDYRKGFRFSTYATQWIRQAMQRELADTGRTIRIPAHAHQRLKSIGNVEREYFAACGELPSNEDLAEMMGLPEEEILFLKKAVAQQPTSLNQHVGENGDSELGALIAADGDPAKEVVQNVSQAKLKRDIDEAIARHLNECEKEVVQALFGIDTDSPEGKTVKEVARELNLHPNTVIHIRDTALTKLERSEYAPAFRDAA